MVIDTSALFAIVASEPERPVLIQAIIEDPLRMISSFTLLEASVVIHSKFEAGGLVRLRAFISRAGVEIVALDEEQVEAAHAAWEKFGKGRAPAALNLGDCCPYALAKTRSQKLLYKGNHFRMTDIESAV